MDYKDYRTKDIVNFLEEQIDLVKTIDKELEKGEDYIFENRKLILYQVNMLGKYTELIPIYDSGVANKIPSLKELSESKVEQLDPRENMLNNIDINGKNTNWYDILYRGLKKELDVINNNISTNQLEKDKSKISLTFHKNDAEIDFLLSLDENTVELLHFSDIEEIKTEYKRFAELNSKYSRYKSEKIIENIEKALNSRNPQTFAKYAEKELNFLELVSIEITSKKSINPKHIEKVENRAIEHIENIKQLEKDLVATKDNILLLRKNIKKNITDITNKFHEAGFELIDENIYDDIYNKDLTLNLDAKKDINRNLEKKDDKTQDDEKETSEKELSEA